MNSAHLLKLIQFRFLSLFRAVLVVLGQVVRELLVGGLGEDRLLPQVGSQVGVGLGDGGIGSLGEVAKGGGLVAGAGVAVLNTSHGQQLLGDGGGDEASTPGGRDQADHDTAALASHLARYCVGLSDLVTPVASPDRDDGQLGKDDGTTDGSGYFLRALDAKTNVAVVVANGNKGLETGPLTGTSLLLDRHDLQNLILQLLAEEEINDFKLLDGQREEVDLLKAADLSILDQAAQLGDGHPLLVSLLAASTAPATATSGSKTTSETSTASTGVC